LGLSSTISAPQQSIVTPEETIRPRMFPHFSHLKKRVSQDINTFFPPLRRLFIKPCHAQIYLAERPVFS
jgi:hypothetical protein